MSLINDALKKAQRDRSGPPSQPAHPAALPVIPPPAAAYPHPALARDDGLGRSLIFGIVIALAIVGGGAVVWMLKPSGTSTAPAAAVVATLSARATPAPNPAPPPPPAPAATETEAPVAAAPAAALPRAPALSPAPVVSREPSAPPAATAALPPTPEPPPLRINLSPTAPAPAAAAPAPAPVAAAPAENAAGMSIRLHLQDPRILSFLDSARLNGIRAAADDPKLLLNSKVFRPGDIVDRELGLKLVQIAPGKLTFEDGQGLVYVKSF